MEKEEAEERTKTEREGLEQESCILDKEEHKREEEVEEERLDREWIAAREKARQDRVAAEEKLENAKQEKA